MTELHISPDLTLPLDAVTETFVILAVKRSGKSNAAVVMAEEMYDAGVPWVAVDPKGDWWGVRAAGDGQAPGLAVLVFGGLHGDVPLEPTAGRLVADLIAEQRITCVLDVSEMSKADQRRFLTDFADRLYRRNSEPLHVFCEEADEYIPQRVMGESAKLVGAFETLVKRGGFRGIGVTLITQRSASLNKDVLTQAGTLIAMRTPSPQDRKAVLAWIDYHAASRDVIDELPTLNAGEAWLFSPQWLKTLQKIRFRRRRTFDSGATPKVGGKPRPPARLADVDLAAIKEAMAETIERAKADDPKELHRQIAELERQLATRPVETVTVTERVEVVPGELIAVVSRARSALLAAADTLTATSAEIGEAEQRAHERNDRADVPRTRPASDPPPAVVRPGPAQRPDRTARREPSRPPVPRSAAATGDLTPRQQQIVDQLAWFESVGLAPADRRQLAFFVGLSARTGNFANLLSGLSTAGLVDYPAPGRVGLTQAGRTAVHAAPDLPATDEALQDAIFAKLPQRLRDVLGVLLAAFPQAVRREDLADALGLSARTGNFANLLSKLRSLDLVDYPSQGLVAAAPLLFLQTSA